MKWTIEPPTKEGWYWADFGDGKIEIVYVSIVADKARFVCVGDEASYKLDIVSLWGDEVKYE